MKKIVLLLSSAAVLSLSARKIEMPIYDNATMTHEFVESVELTDKDATFDIVILPICPDGGAHSTL